MKKNKKPKITTIAPKIIGVNNSNNANTKFIISFEFYNEKNKNINIDNITDNKDKLKIFSDLIHKIQEYSEIENFKKEITSNIKYKNDNHIHPIKWSNNDVSENCFNIDNKIFKEIKDDCWQLGINNNGCKIHGFFIENVFYLVWIDPNHKLYPGDR